MSFAGILSRPVAFDLLDLYSKVKPPKNLSFLIQKFYLSFYSQGVICYQL